MHNRFHRDDQLEAAARKIRELERALTAARQAADLETRSAQLARESAATAWRLAFGPSAQK